VYVVTGADVATPLAAASPYIAAEMAREGVDAEPYVSHVDAPTVIFEAVHRFEPDLLVLGALRKGAAGALWFGQAWQQIVEQVDMPVLLYR
jgi:nucleotide-binding universal stress UspA family protein